MNAEHLLEAIGHVDDELLERSHRRRSPRLLALAACAALVLLGALLWKPPSSAPEFIFDSRTSEQFQDLDTLLKHLSATESHTNAEKFSKGPIDIISEGQADGPCLATYGDYAYHKGFNKVQISQLSEPDLGVVATIDTAGLSQIFGYEYEDYYNAADQIYVVGQTLIVVRDGIVPDAVDYVPATYVQLYDLADPLDPAPIRAFQLNGYFSDASMDNGTLVVLTCDGACACGWSGNRDDYAPALFIDGALQSWSNEEISILGSPNKLAYLSAVRIDCDSATLKDKHTFYGNIKQAFFGGNWLALQVGGAEAYTFRLDGSINYTGKLSSDQIFSILSVTDCDNGYRLIAKGMGGSLLSLEAQPTTGYSRCASYVYSDWEAYQALQILWEDERAIVLATSWTDDHEAIYSLPFQCALTIVDYSSSSIVFSKESLPLLPSSQLLHGNPHLRKYLLGQLQLLIPIGDGIYSFCPGYGDRLDLLDLSDSASPKLLRQAKITLPAGGEFKGSWEVYAPGIIGIQSGPAWGVFRVDPEAEEPYQLLDLLDLTQEPYHELEDSDDRFTVFGEDFLYLTTLSSQWVYRLNW